MRCRSILFAIAVMNLFAVAAMPQAIAQPVKHGNYEMTVLGAFSMVIPWQGLDVQEISLPTGSGVLSTVPALRLTYWANSNLTFDIGFSYQHESSGGDKTEVFNVEGGIGASFGHKESLTQPFCSLLFGLLSVSDGSSASDSYLGGQIGIRQFVRDYAATHLQVGYRSMLGDKFRFSTLELAVGVGFFL